MHRQQPPENPRLEGLMHERDHIRIRISLELDKASKNDELIEVLYTRLQDVEDRITVFERQQKANRY